MKFFTEHFKECGVEENVQMCQFCHKMICSTCLKRLTYRQDTPQWFVGKKVKDFTEFRNLYHEYCKIIKKKGGHIHCCDNFLQETWTVISKQVKQLEHDRDQEASTIILK